MNPIDQLKAVLCDPTGKCCIDGSDEDRAIIDKALQALAQPEQEPTWATVKHYCDRIVELEAQLAPPRKEWVGLTNNELQEILDCGRGFWTNAKKIEQLLKDKNI